MILHFSWDNYRQPFLFGSLVCQLWHREVNAVFLAIHLWTVALLGCLPERFLKRLPAGLTVMLWGVGQPGRGPQRASLASVPPQECRDQQCLQGMGGWRLYQASHLLETILLLFPCSAMCSSCGQ